MLAPVTEEALKHVQQFACPCTGSREEYDPLLKLVGDARYVLLGEATHGTHEFYKARADITQRLVEEKGFTVIAWEADWPDALRVNRYIQGKSGDGDPEQSLRGFQRFPTWMWRNLDISDLLGRLRNYNDSLPESRPKAGIFGLDLYSLHSSMNAVIEYLDQADPDAARAARERYSCFEHFGEPQEYGRAAYEHRSLSCEDEVVQQLAELQRHAADFLSRDGRIAADELFFAEQNARVAKNAEKYYRAMFHGRPNTWNLRDTHMAETLDLLLEHLRRQGENPKAVVWAHNSHLGDARATQMSERGELNLGQIVRERHGSESLLVGFTTYTGTVTAASDWGGIAERKQVRRGLEGSYESLLHASGIPKFVLPIRGNRELATSLGSTRLERAIGVIYRPHTELWSHYFHARLSRQFDAVIHADESCAVEPLERTGTWERGELPETFPSGF